MGFIDVETPDGIGSFEISGDKPTNQEMEVIRSTIYGQKEDLSFPDLREIDRPQGTPDETDVEQLSFFEPSNEGEIQDHSFQFFYGRADNDSDREARLTSEFGPESFIKIASDDYALDLNKISSEKKQEYDLPQSGTIRVNQPGLSWYDVSGFLGAEAVPLTAALGVGLMSSGVGIIPGMLLQAAAGAGGKAIDELVFEKMEGLQTQSDDQIYGDVITTGALYGAGELVGRGIFAGARRLLKGPGPTPAQSRVLEIAKNENISEKEATKIAREELKQELRVAVKAGARPTIEEVSGKSIQGRLQAIYEGIFPNPEAAVKNRKFIDDTLKSLAKGDVTEAEAKAILNDNAEAVTDLVRNAMKNANVEQASKLAEQHLTKVIDNEFKLIKDLYNPRTGLTTNWQQGLNQVARLFDQDSAVLYKKSEDLLKGLKDGDGASIASFSSGKLKEIMKDIQGDKITSSVLGDTFSKGLFKYINETPAFNLTELTSLRAALRMSAKDPGLTPGILDRHIGKMVKSINETIDDKLGYLASLRSGKGDFGASEESLDQGVRALQLAQRHHSRGISRFKQGAVEMLDKNIKQGVLFGEKAVLETIVQPGNATQLNSFLKSVTPSGRSIGGITSVSPTVFDDAASLALTKGPVSKGEPSFIEQAANLLRANDVPDDVLPKVPDFIKQLKSNDPYLADITTQFAGQMRNYSKLASNRSTPLEFRNGIRDSIAKEWFSQAERTSQTLGRFDAVSFVQKFDALGADVQKALFGKQNAEAIRSLTRDYLILGRPTKEISEAISETLGSTASAIRAKAEGLSGNVSIKDQLSQLKEITKIAQEQSEDALFRAVKSGKIENADDLVQAVLKSPQNYDKLVKVIGEDALSNPNNINLKDMIMSRILAPAFPDGVTSDAVSSGSWGKPVRDTIAKLNRNGSLNKILGKDVVGNLIKASKLGERISDISLGGKAALAPATFAAGAMANFIRGPLQLLGKATGIYFIGRAFRSKIYLDSLLKPNYGGKRLYEKGIAAGADLGKGNPALMELKDRLYQQARLIAATSLAPDSDTREQVSQGVEAVKSQVQPVVQPIVQDLQQMQQQLPSPSQATSALRQAELNKLLGMQ